MTTTIRYVPVIVLMMICIGTVTPLLSVRLCAQGTVNGVVFNDLNGNGRQDPGEPGIRGRKIRAAGIMNRSGNTDDSGRYVITGLRAGAYTISEDTITGWVQTMPPSSGTYAVRISNDTLIWDSLYFGDRGTRISGLLFSDLNGNGRQDPGEPGLKGWTIQAIGSNTISKKTNDSGGYSFDNIQTGNYTLHLKTLRYWSQSMPPFPGDYSVQLSNETPVLDSLNFGAYTGQVSGTIYNDLNSNGRMDPGEQGLSGFSLRIAGPRSVTARTDRNGNYTYTGLPAGAYQVYQRARSGWIQTMPPAPGIYNLQIAAGTPTWDSINFGNSAGMRFSGKTEGMGFRIPTDARLMTRNLACDTGDIYLCGYSNEWGSRMDYVTIKYENGRQAWISRYNNASANLDDKAFALALDNYSGSVFVTGESYSTPGRADIVTVRYSGEGTEQWVARWKNDAFGGLNAGYAIALNRSGTTVFVAGETHGGTAHNADYITIAYDAASGAQLWQATYNGPGSKVDKVYAIAVAPNGNPVVTGESDGGTTKADYATIMYDGATGAQTWLARYDGGVLKKDQAFAVRTDDAGNVFVTGASEARTGCQYATIKYNAAGELQWAGRYDEHTKRNFGYDLVLDPSGNVYVTGASQGDKNYFSFATVKYDPNGALVWANRYHKGREIARSIDYSSADGKIFVAGSSYINSTHLEDYLLQKIDAQTGVTEWVTSYNGTGSRADIAYNVKVCPSEASVAVTGTSNGGMSSNLDFLTLKFPSGTSSVIPFENGDFSAVDDSDAVDGGDVDAEPADDMDGMVPAQTLLKQNYPNPFNPVTTIQYQIETDSRVSLKIYNILGQVVQILTEGVEEAGYRRIEWNASNFASGMYFCRLEAVSVSDPTKAFSAVKKMLLVK